MPATTEPQVAELTNLQEVPVTLEFLRADGSPAPVDGIPVWSNDAEDTVSVEVAQDGKSATIHTRGPVGTARITVTADVNPGAGVIELIGVLEVDVVSDGSMTIRFNVGTPVDRTV